MLHAREKVVVFCEKYPHIGPIVWMSSIQYFIIQVIVASAWQSGYSWSGNTISDLGATICGDFAGRFVCSPLSIFMNGSIMFLGVLVAIGSFLIYQEFRESWMSFVGFALMALAGLGTFVVGLVPVNTHTLLHNVGAFLTFAAGAVSLLVLTFALYRVHLVLRLYTFLTALTSIVAFTLFLTDTYLGLGIGGMERLASYPVTIWFVLFGFYISVSHFRRGKKGRKCAAQ